VHHDFSLQSWKSCLVLSRKFCWKSLASSKRRGPPWWGLTVFDSLIIRISWWDGSVITFLMCPIWWFYNHLCYPSFGHTVFLPHLDNQTRKSLAEILIGATRMKVGYWNAGTKRTLAYLEKIAMMPPLYSLWNYTIYIYLSFRFI